MNIDEIFIRLNNPGCYNWQEREKLAKDNDRCWNSRQVSFLNRLFFLHCFHIYTPLSVFCLLLQKVYLLFFQTLQRKIIKKIPKYEVYFPDLQNMGILSKNLAYIAEIEY